CRGVSADRLSSLDADERILQPIRCKIPARRPAVSLDDVSGPWRAARIKRRAVSLVGEPRVDHAVERDAVPGQLAVRFDEVPKAGARLGVGGPRLHSAARASGREDRYSEYTELRHGSPPALDVDDPDLENDNYKTVSTLTKNFGSEWRPRHSGFCTPWQTQAIRGQSLGYGAS